MTKIQNISTVTVGSISVPTTSCVRWNIIKREEYKTQ